MVKRETPKAAKAQGSKPRRHLGHLREKKARPVVKKASKEKFPDFQKNVKRRVGKKKLKPATSLNPVVRSQSIMIRTMKAPTPADGQYRSDRGRTIAELLPKLGHYSGTVRREAFAALSTAAKARGLDGSPVVAPSQAGSLLLRCLPAVLDEDRGVRQALLAALRALFAHCLPRERAAPFINVVLRYANVALTHIEPEVQKTGIELLTAFFQAYREALHSADLACPEGSQVLCSLVRFSRAEYTLAGRRTVGALQVLNLLVTLLQIQLTGVDDPQAPDSTPCYNGFWASVVCRDPLLEERSTSALPNLPKRRRTASGRADRAPTAHIVPSSVSLMPVSPVEVPGAHCTGATSTPSYFRLVTEEDRLHFFDDVVSVLRSRWVEVNPARRADSESEGPEPGALHEAGYLALAVNTAVAIVARDAAPWVTDRERVVRLLGPARRGLLCTFVAALPLPEPLARGEAVAHLHATLQLALLGSLFVPHTRAVRHNIDGTAAIIFEAVMDILEDPDMNRLEAPCTPCPSAPLAGVPCVTLLMVVAERLVDYLPASSAGRLSAALLAIFNASASCSAVKREGLRFLRRHTDRSLLGPEALLRGGGYFEDWAAALPRWVWQTRHDPLPEQHAAALHALQAALAAGGGHPAEASGKAMDGPAERRRQLQSAAMKALWSASRPCGSGNVESVPGAVAYWPQPLQERCGALLFAADFRGADPEQVQLQLGAVAAAVRTTAMPVSVLSLIIEALHCHRDALPTLSHARFLLDLLTLPTVDPRTARSVQCALRAAYLGADVNDRPAFQEQVRCHCKEHGPLDLLASLP